jgi:hypothetical protein
MPLGSVRRDRGVKSVALGRRPADQDAEQSGQGEEVSMDAHHRFVYHLHGGCDIFGLGANRMSDSADRVDRSHAAASRGVRASCRSRPACARA